MNNALEILNKYYKNIHHFQMLGVSTRVVGGLSLGRTKHERDIPSPFGF